MNKAFGPFTTIRVTLLFPADKSISQVIDDVDKFAHEHGLRLQAVFEREEQLTEHWALIHVPGDEI